MQLEMKRGCLGFSTLILSYLFLILNMLVNVRRFKPYPDLSFENVSVNVKTSGMKFCFLVFLFCFV